MRAEARAQWGFRLIPGRAKAFGVADRCIPRLFMDPGSARVSPPRRLGVLPNLKAADWGQVRPTESGITNNIGMHQARTHTRDFPCVSSVS